MYNNGKMNQEMEIGEERNINIIIIIIIWIWLQKGSLHHRISWSITSAQSP